MCRCKCAWWMVLEWNVFEDGECSIGFDLYPSQHQKGLLLHVHGGGGAYQEVCVINVQCVKWLFSHFSLKSVWLPAFL